MQQQHKAFLKQKIIKFKTKGDLIDNRIIYIFWNMTVGESQKGSLGTLWPSGVVCFISSFLQSEI